jgi:hypothetical protein
MSRGAQAVTTGIYRQKIWTLEVGTQSPLWVCAVTRRRFPVGASPAPAGSSRGTMEVTK